MESYLGTILPWPLPYAPKGWIFCTGQILNVSTNQALFSLLGTRYGGNGTTTFGIPDLRDRFIFGAPTPDKAGVINSSPVNLTGSQKLVPANLPAHSHPATVVLTNLSAKTTIKAGTVATGSTQVPVDNCVLNASPNSDATAAAIYLPTTVTPPGTVELGNVSTTLTGEATLTVGKNTTTNDAITVNTSFTPNPPSLGMNFIICTMGLYPTRN